VCHKRAGERVADPTAEDMAAWVFENVDTKVPELLSGDPTWREQTEGRFQGVASPYGTELEPEAWLFDETGLVPDVVLRFESLAEDFADLCSRFGVENRLEHRNRHSYRGGHHYRDYYSSEESVEAVRKNFSRVIDHFGYEF